MLYLKYRCFAFAQHDSPLISSQMMNWRVVHPDDEALVTVARFQNYGDFLVAKTMLESAEIDCIARNEYGARFFGELHGLSNHSYVELQVREADAEDARAVLESESPLDENESPDELDS